MNKNTTSCGSCGRSWHTTPAGCNYCDSCLTEYPYSVPACIKNKQPDCMAKAVIPSITTETVDGITSLANCFVHVTNINTTFYIDDKHRPMITWAGDVEVDLPSGVDTEEEWAAFLGSFDLREQTLKVKHYSQEDNKNHISAFYFDKTGAVYFSGEYGPVDMGEELI